MKNYYPQPPFGGWGWPAPQMWPTPPVPPPTPSTVDDQIKALRKLKKMLKEDKEGDKKKDDKPKDKTFNIAQVFSILIICSVPTALLQIGLLKGSMLLIQALMR